MNAVRRFQYGQEVMVFDKNGNYELRGKIVGMSYYNPPLYDIAPRKCESLATHICGVPEYQLRRVSAPIQAYEHKIPQDAKHIKDDA